MKGSLDAVEQARALRGRLKSGLSARSADHGVRRELVAAYRAMGSTDQAGRYAIGLPEGAHPGEIAAYGSMLRALAADEQRARQLSVLASDAELPVALIEIINAPPESDAGWVVSAGFVAILLWLAIPLTAVIGASIVYIRVWLGEEGLQDFAQVWNVVCAWWLVLALGMTAIWRAGRRRPVSTVVLGACSALAAAGAWAMSAQL